MKQQTLVPLDLALAIGLAAIALSLAYGPFTNPVVGMVFGLPLVLVLPGYTFTAAVFPRESLGRTERILFSVGLSFTITILGGLALNLTPWGLTRVTWVIWLVSFTLFTSGVALWKEFNRQKRGPAPTLPFVLSMREVALIGLAEVLVVAAVVIARTPTPPQAVQGYSMLWLLPADQSDAVRVGFSSMEFNTTRYKMELDVNGTVQVSWPSLDLQPGQSYEAIVPLGSDAAIGAEIEAVLYRADQPDLIYRHVVLYESKASQ